VRRRRLGRRAPGQQQQPSSPPPILAAPTEIFAQIGAFGAREAAQRAWSHLAETFPEALAGKTMRIDQVTVNGATMYRSSIAGFSGQSDAQALCTRLMASSESCFVRHGP
jgi:cell division protein FtsN